jgi:hypothetical protein
MAMGPKVDEHLILSKNGKTVKVTGPTGGWDPYLKSATFTVVIGQVQEEKIVLAVGRASVAYGAGDWAATAKVLDPPGDILQLGPAYAWAVASGEAFDGAYEPYEWSVYTRLVAKAAPKVAPKSAARRRR